MDPQSAGNIIGVSLCTYPRMRYPVPMTTTDTLSLTAVLADLGVHVPTRAINRFLALGLPYGESFTNARADAAREAGLVYACTGCGSVGGIDVTGMDEAISEPIRQATRDSIDFDAWSCCPDATTHVF